MSTSWVIEKFRHQEEESERLAEAVRAAGFVAIEYHPYRGLDRDVIEQLSAGPVAFHGSCFGSKVFARDCPAAVPGSFVSWSNYECREYFGHWGDLCLNTPTARIYSIARVMDEADTLFSAPKFVKPDLGTKVFAGEVFESADAVRKGLLDIIFEGCQGIKIVLAEPQELGREWRVFYDAASLQRSIICGSQYRDRGKLAIEGGVPEHVCDWIKENFEDQQWYPDPIFALDIVEVLPKKTLRLLEISAANVAGLYAADLSAFVKSMSQQARKQFAFHQKKLSNF